MINDPNNDPATQTERQSIKEAKKPYRDLSSNPKSYREGWDLGGYSALIFYRGII